jgi:5-methyltetrahydrofolate--homocysteine methyltransferase
MSDVMLQIKEMMKKGKAKDVQTLVQQALDEGFNAPQILDEALLDAMNEIGVRFKAGEAFVPEVLVAARAMNKGIEVLKPHLAEGDVEDKGVAILGTVKGDLHDIGKNLVRIMIEGKGIKVIDLGIDVSEEAFVNAVNEYNPQLVCMSALLTTTMPEMQVVINALEEAGVRDKVRVMIGGAPVTQNFADEIGADSYTEDATAASEAAIQLLEDMA